MSTPDKKRAIDSPSRQLLWELNQFAISSQEGFYAHLDREGEEREDQHKQALATAARKHERVRESAEIEKRRVEEEQEAWQRRQEEEQRKALEALRRENELAEQRREVERIRVAQQHERELVEVQRSKAQIEERQRAEEERQKAANARKLREEQDTRTQKLREAEAAANNMAKEEALNAVHVKSESSPVSSTLTAAMPASQPLPQAVPTRPAAINSEWEAEHKRYLEIHQRLKDLRKFMTKTAKERPELKEEMGNMRRAIKKSVGQLNKTKGGNTRPLKTIIDTLKHALTLPSPEIDIPTFLATPLSPPSSSASPQTTTTTTNTGPALLIYLLNTFSKDIIAQFLSEASVDPTAADGIGVIASHIFALGFFRWHTHSLIDILLAKLHVVAPALFGIYPTGPSSGEATAAGKTRLGWWREEGRSAGPFINPQQHFMRMTGLAAGFAALSLRNYEKAKAINPFPEHHYWTCLARIASTPTQLMTQTQFVLLKALVEGYESKFIGFYGGAAVAALRELLVELPARCQSSVASKSLAGLKDVLARDKKLFL